MLPPPPDHAQLLDGTVLARFRADLAEAFPQIVQVFLRDSAKLLEDLRQGLEEGAAERVRRAAHTLASGSASFGATGFAARCRALEQQAKAGRLADGLATAPSLLEEGNRVRAAVAALEGES